MPNLAFPLSNWAAAVMPDLTLPTNLTPRTKRHVGNRAPSLRIFSRSIAPRSLRDRLSRSLHDRSVALFTIAFSLSLQSLPRSIRDRSLALFVIAPTLSSRSLPRSLRDRSLALFAISPSLSSRSLPRSLREHALDHLIFLFVISTRQLSCALPS